MEPGDIIEFDYELYVEGHDGLYDTTLKEAAEEAGIHEENAYYAPMRYVVGSGRLIAGLEEALDQAEVGKTFEVEVPPEKGYGKRDANRFETVSLKEFKKNKVEPEVGMVVNWRNRRGVVSTVGGGRVRIDFNPPLAGKTLTYKVTVRRVYDDEAGRVKAILLMNYPSADEPEVTMDGKIAVVTLPEVAKYDPNWTRSKVGFLSSVRRHTDVERVRLVEEHDLDAGSAEEAKEAAAEAAD